MDVFIERERKKVQLSFEGLASDLLEKLKINPETVLIARNGTIITEKDELKDADAVSILSVVSGG
jgi:thiamine biosynthesis protein ThiS